MAANVEGLNPDLRARVNALIRASGGRITIVSGYRSPEHQARLVEAAKKKHGAGWRKWVAPPGKSNHNKGEAVDLGGDLALAHRLAPQFNLSFPMAWEKWHVQRAEFKSSKDALTTAPTTFQGAKAAIAAGAAPSAPATTPAAVATDPDPNDRRSLDVQLSSFLSILDKPIDFTGQEVA